MADGDDLPDGEYESIYGHEALHARLMAQLDAILKRQDRLLQRPLRGGSEHGDTDQTQ